MSKEVPVSWTPGVLLGPTERIVSLLLVAKSGPGENKTQSCLLVLKPAATCRKHPRSPWIHTGNCKDAALGRAQGVGATGFGEAFYRLLCISAQQPTLNSHREGKKCVTLAGTAESVLLGHHGRGTGVGLGHLGTHPRL